MKIFALRTFVSTLLLLVSFNLFAEEWGFLLNRSGDNKPIEVNWSSIKNDRGLTFIDIRYSPIAGLKSLFGDVSLYKENIAIDCPAESYASMSTVAILKNGSQRTESVTSLPDLRFIKPSKYSNEGKVLQKLCEAISKTKQNSDSINTTQEQTKPKNSKILERNLSYYDWRFTAATDDDSVHTFINTDSIKRVKNSFVGLIIKQQHRKALKTLAGIYYTQSASQILIDCKNSTVVMTGYDFYNANDLLIDTYYMDSSEWKENAIPKGSVLDLVKDTACNIGLSQSSSSEDTKNPTSAIFTGTGWLINPNHLVTAAHVVNNAKNIAVIFRDEAINASIVSSDDYNDIAILKLSKPLPLKPLILASNSSKLGDDIWVMGFPLSSVLGNKIQLTTGVVSATAGIGNDKRILQITAPIQPGNSGGPLLNSNGNVVGVVTSKLDDKSMNEQGVTPQNVNFSIKIPYVKALLDASNVSFNTQNTKQNQKKLSNLAEEIQSSIFLIVVESNQ